MGTFGPVTVRVPRARLDTSDGKTVEWKNATIPAYQRRTKQADALIAGAYLAGTNTRRVRRALAALFGGAVGKDTVSRVWRKVKGDWDAWNARSLKDEPIIRLILDGTIVRVRLDKKATSISLLVALGVRQDGQKVLLAVKNMGGESEAAWRALLDDLVKRGLKMPELVIVDGAPGLEKALAALWSDMPVQRCTVHKHRNLLAHAPDRLHEEISADYFYCVINAIGLQVVVASTDSMDCQRRSKRRPAGRRKSRPVCGGDRTRRAGPPRRRWPGFRSRGGTRRSGSGGDFAGFWVGGSGFTPPPCLRLFEPVALAVELQNMNMMRQPIE